MTFKHLHAQQGVALNRVVGFDRPNDLMHATHHARKIDFTKGFSNTEPVGISKLLHGLGRAN